jgi:hypothetical protein
MSPKVSPPFAGHASLCLTFVYCVSHIAEWMDIKTWGSRLEGAGVLEFGFEFKTNALTL